MAMPFKPQNGCPVIVEACAYGTIAHIGMKGRIDQPFGWYPNTGNGWKVTGIVNGTRRICYAATQIKSSY